MVENRPLTAEGAAALEAVTNPAAWRFAGMAGAITGIDMRDALARIDMTGLDAKAVRLIAADGEHGVLKGAARAARDAADKRNV